MGGLLFWYNEEEPGWAAAPPSPILFVLNVTAHPSTASVPYQLHITRCGTVITGRPEAQPCRVLHLLSGVFAPYGRHITPIKVKFGTGQISCLSGQKCGNTAPKTIKFSHFGHKFAPQENGLVCPIFMKFLAFVRVSR